jgi:hypothetical protein
MSKILIYLPIFFENIRISTINNNNKKKKKKKKKKKQKAWKLYQENIR